MCKDKGQAFYILTKKWQPIKQKNERYGYVLYKEKAHGRKIKINEAEFYTRTPEHISEENWFVYDARTGIYCGSVRDLKEKYARYLKNVKNIPDIKEVPKGKGGCTVWIDNTGSVIQHK